MFARGVDSGESGGTGRVHRDAWTAEVQTIGNSIRGDRVSAAGRSVGRDPEVIERGALHSLIIIVRNTDKHADVAALLEIEDDAGVLDRFPGCLEQQAMLRIDVRRFPRRDAEKLRIE